MAMKRKIVMNGRMLILLAASLSFAACGAPSTMRTNNAAGAAASPQAPPAAATQAAAAAPDPDAPVKFLFADYPVTETKAKPDEYVLCPSQNFIVEMSQGGGKKNTGTTYVTARMLRPGATESEVKSLYASAPYKVPNAYLVVIPYGQKAAVGDVVLTWWQSGSGIQRAIVTDASNPSEPTVRYLGKLSDKDKQEKLQPNSFVKLDRPFQPGSGVAVNKGGGRVEPAQVINTAGDKVFVRDLIGMLLLVNKADCTPVPENPAVKAGDRVKAVRFNSFRDATVVGVDAKLGKVVVRVDGENEDQTIDFGQVMKA